MLHYNGRPMQLPASTAVIHAFRFRLSLIVPTLLILAAACRQVTVPVRVTLLRQAERPVYSDQDWAEVLRTRVHDGLVDYASLARAPEPLDRYGALISIVGPASTPDQFTSSEQTTAYWVNAYTACVLRAVVGRYPVSSMYDLSMPRLEYEYTFQVDGQVRTLADMEQEILKHSRGDVRALLATSRAAVGTPRLPAQPLRASSLERQLSEAAADALDQPEVLRVDHASQSILVWQLILRRQAEFTEYWRTRRRVRNAQAYSVLLELASPAQRRVLQSAVGYTLRELPFNRTLNSWPVEREESSRP